MGLFSLFTSISGFYLSVFFKEYLGFSGMQIGILFAIQASCGVLAALPTGIANDLITSRTLVALSLLVMALGYFLMPKLHYFPPYMVMYFFWSLANAVFRLSLDVQVLKTDSGKRTASRIGLYQALRFLGLFVGTVTLGYLIAYQSFETIFCWVSGACLFLTALSFGLEKTRLESFRLSEYRSDMKKPQVVFFAVWMFLFSTHWGAESTSIGPFLRIDMRLSWVGLGWYSGAEFLTVVAALLLFRAHLNDNRHMRSYTWIGLIASGIGSVGMVLRPLVLSLVFRVIHGIGDAIMFLILYLGIARLFSFKRLGGNTGFISMFTMLGFVTGALIYGPLGEAYGYDLPLWCSGLVTCLLVLPFFSNIELGKFYEK
jgi:MFS family permease